MKNSLTRNLNHARRRHSPNLACRHDLAFTIMGQSMGTEIERKFLPKGDLWKRAITAPGARIRQGYLASGRGRTVRVRTSGDNAWITVKGPTTGASRAEFEYPIPLEDAGAMLDSLCEQPLIEKTRYVVEGIGCVFEIDEFHSENTENQPVDLPEWIGEEVTGDSRYYNSTLARHPYSSWPDPA
jgi:CYTH domain-containing protein